MVLDDYKIKKTKQRLDIFNYFINNKNIEIKDLIENFNYDESTIYRIINLFLEKDIISKKVNNNKIIYNLHSNHKHILKCTKCKKEELIDCPYENIDLKGFKLENKVINGICKDCQVKRIGVFVGSFDPITNAHIEIANLLLKQDLVDTILLVPCNSFKNTIDIKTRLDMINLICTDNIISSDIEIINGRRNFSYKNMDEIKNMYPKNAKCTFNTSSSNNVLIMDISGIGNTLRIFINTGTTNDPYIVGGMTSGYTYLASAGGATAGDISKPYSVLVYKK